MSDHRNALGLTQEHVTLARIAVAVWLVAGTAFGLANVAGVLSGPPRCSPDSAALAAFGFIIGFVMAGLLLAALVGVLCAIRFVVRGRL